MHNAALLSGHVSMLLYVFLIAISSLLIHGTNQQVTPLLSAFYTFLFCLFVYNCMPNKLFTKIDMLKKYWLEIVMLNITTAVCWIFTFFSLRYLAPELYLSIYLCAMPMTSALLSKKHLIKTAAMAVGLIFLVGTYHEKNLIDGVALAFLGGACGTIYSINSKKISAEFSTLEILSLRFYLIVILTLVISDHMGMLHWMRRDFYFQFMLLSLVSVVIPLTLFQVGIKNLSLPTALSYLPFAPAFCYFLHFLSGDAPFHLFQLIAIIFISLILFF